MIAPGAMSLELPLRSDKLGCFFTYLSRGLISSPFAVFFANYSGVKNFQFLSISKRSSVLGFLNFFFYLEPFPAFGCEIFLPFVVREPI